MEEMYDITVIGGGPAGLFAAFYAALRNCRVLLLEALPALGGQPATLYPEKKIWDVPGQVGVRARDLVQALEAQLTRFPVDIVTDSKVTDLVSGDQGFELTVNDGQAHYRSKTVIVATGHGAFEPRRLQLANEVALTGQGLTYFAPNPAAFAGQRVAVLGGGDSALDLALTLAEKADQVYLIHRRVQFRALESTVKALQQSRVIQKLAAKIVAAQPVNQQLALDLAAAKDRADTVQEQLLVDQLIVQFGFLSKDQTLQAWALPLTRTDRGVLVTDQVATNIPGLYAIGDVSDYGGHVDLIATAFGQGPSAVNAAVAFFDPDRGGPGHSSALDLG
ncbi:NAD(P)/FAD-dependent oxidoreductase [Leuconostocaceae bacterium ESL0958]|nr:NAD(P)/FAD-dependent oxidoreductase [Leuconostocaceae bacterium ESL0958]